MFSGKCRCRGALLKNQGSRHDVLVSKGFLKDVIHRKQTWKFPKERGEKNGLYCKTCWILLLFFFSFYLLDLTGRSWVVLFFSWH